MAKKIISWTREGEELVCTAVETKEELFRGDPYDCPEAIVTEFNYHGFKQKMGDYIAASKDAKFTIPEIKIRLNELFEQLKGGEWSKKKQSATKQGLVVKIDKTKALAEMIESGVAEAVATGIIAKLYK